jgi:hypothetical protein
MKVFKFPALFAKKVKEDRPKAYIHCGTFKTGSSSIQNFLFNNREQLDSVGVLFPKTGLMFHDPEIGQRHWHFAYKFNDIKLWNSLYEKLRKEIKSSNCDTVIFSAEAWSKPGTSESLKELKDRLQSDGFDVYGIIYLRNRYDYGRSLYREFTRRWGNKSTFQQFIAQDLNKKTLNFEKLLRDFIGIFENKSLIIDYEKVGNVVEHFNKVVGIEIEQPLLPQIDKRQNKSLDSLAIELYRLKNSGVDNFNNDEVLKLFPNWIRNSVSEKYPDNYFPEIDKTFREFTRFNKTRVKQLLNYDKHENEEDISSLSELINNIVLDATKEINNK